MNVFDLLMANITLNCILFMHRDTPYKFLQLEIYGVPELQGKNYKKTLPAIDKRVSRIDRKRW